MISLLATAIFSVQIVDQDSLESFVDKNRLNYEGPASITRLGKVDRNDDGVEDHLIAFTFGWDENRHGRLYGQMVAAFVSTTSATFEATNVLLISESDLIFYNNIDVENRGPAVAVRGLKRIPGDAQCCPTARAEIVFDLVDGKLKAIMGSWQYDPELQQ